ncbi:MAG TPA: glycoside hydrolase family 15 protein [Planctomycetota bacterium]|nr:glycoside hydrolase family 15 protein [Planctomycetota bacterium]
MPRDLPIGNGRLLVTFDCSYCVRDIYYPRVGKENQTLGEPCRTGIWINGAFSWLHESGWKRSLKYQPGTLVTDVKLQNENLRVRIDASDAVHPDQTIFLRHFVVHNDADEPREVRLFFHYDFHILENAFGDTAYFEPVNGIIVQYKGPRYFLINARNAAGEGIYQYSTGIKKHQHFEGTWRDAEDGELGGNPITQGSVDSTISVRCVIPARESSHFHHWVCADRDYFGAKELNDLVLRHGVHTMMEAASDHWRKWVMQARGVGVPPARSASESCDAIPDAEQIQSADARLEELYRRSLLIVNTQIDSGGAIIAANDGDSIIFNRDTYSYMWPRDGALVSHALDLAGFPEIARKFFLFCQSVMPRPSYYPEGYLLHKFNPDGSFGSSWHPWIRDGKPALPIQEDETALVLWALNEHHKIYKDDAFIASVTERLIRPAAKFMLKYRISDTGLPRESYDLWEERYGVLTFTTAAVIAGLAASAKLLTQPQDSALQADCFEAAAQMKSAMQEHLFSKELNRFVRMISFQNGGGTVVDSAIDASVYAIFQFGVFEADHPMVVATMKQVESRLWCKTDVGGVARYENDYYYQISHDVAKVPGNPWMICTLWLALWYLALAKTRDELKRSREILDWIAAHCLESGCMAEQIHPYTGAPLSVSPLTWSHATYIETVLKYWEKWERLA